MGGSLEILLTESPYGEDKVITLELSDADAIRLSLPPAILVLQSSSVERVRALLKRQDEPFHVVVIEIDVPDMANLKPVSELTKEFPSTPVLILSTQYTRDIALEATTRCGVQKFLVKSMVHEDLFARSIIEAIDQQRTKRKIEKIIVRLREALKE